MKTHYVTITKRKIFVPSVDDSTINALDRGSDQIYLEYDREWEGLDIYLILFDGPKALVTRYEEEPLIFPDEAYTRADVIPLTVVGLGKDGFRIVAHDDRAFFVRNREGIGVDIPGGDAV